MFSIGPIVDYCRIELSVGLYVTTENGHSLNINALVTFPDCGDPAVQLEEQMAGAMELIAISIQQSGQPLWEAVREAEQSLRVAAIAIAKKRVKGSMERNRFSL
jgi:hypothetical protein